MAGAAYKPRPVRYNTTVPRRPAVWLLSSLCLVACEKPVELDGIVTSRLDGYPVRGVSIVRLGEQELQLGTTGTDGCFAFRNVHERSGRSRQIKFSALGYASATVTIPVGDAKRVRVVLTPDMQGGPSEASVENLQQGKPLPCSSATAR
jgi:hypothetical protein